MANRIGDVVAGTNGIPFLQEADALPVRKFGKIHNVPDSQVAAINGLHT